MNLLAKSCFAPGLINIISNLIASSSDSNSSEDIWEEQYGDGMTHEMYRVQLSEKMEDKTFRDISKTVYQMNKAIVFALEL